MELQKATYGLLRSAPLFDLKLETYLKNNGFFINIYYTCVENKPVKGEAIPVVWHVDSLNIFHRYPFEVTNYAQYFSNIR